MNIGITGHQYLEEFDIGWIKRSLSSLLNDVKITKGFTSLAIGADQLFAEELLTLNKPYEVVIPCLNYELTFNGKDLSNYKRLLELSTNIQYLDFKIPSEEAFYSAGLRVVDSATVLIAIWDGKKAKGSGGTADIFEYALGAKKNIWHINPISKTKLFLQ